MSSSFLRKYSLGLKELTLVAAFKLSGRLFQVLGTAPDKLLHRIPSFFFEKVVLIFYRKNATGPTGQKN